MTLQTIKCLDINISMSLAIAKPQQPQPCDGALPPHAALIDESANIFFFSYDRGFQIFEANLAGAN